MLNTKILVIITDFESESQQINNKIKYDDHKKDLLKQSTKLNNIMTALINYNDQYLNVVVPEKKSKVKESIVKAEINKYNIKLN